MKNVLILNQAHTCNLGDIAIGESISSWISENGWNPITLPFWDENSVFKSLSYTKFSALLKTIPFTANIIVGRWVKQSLDLLMKSQNIDCAVIGGGELFCSHRGFNASFYCWVKEFVKRGIPVCVLGVSGDKGLNSTQVKRNKEALSHCFLVSVRDKYSVSVFNELYDINADYAPDSVFLLHFNLNNNESDGLVCVPVRLTNEMLESFGELSDVDYYFKQIVSLSHVNHVVFTSTEERDQSYIKELCEKINIKYKTDFVYAPYVDIESFCAWVSSAKYVLSGRMHAMIIGLLHGCKPIPITFKKKLQVFNEEYCCNVNIDDVVNLVRTKYENYKIEINDIMS